MVARLPNIHGLLPEDLAVLLEPTSGARALRDARRALANTLSYRPGEIPPRARLLPNTLRAALETRIDTTRPEVVERVTDPDDGCVRYLFRSPDGALSEAVRIPLERDGYTVCLSSQVGCALGCTFCATGRLGLARNLAPWEMVGAFATVRDEAPGRVRGALFMGQGEPLHNEAAVLRAAAILSHPCGARVAAKSITISTVGVADAIRRFAAAGHHYRLIVSLTSAIEARRVALMPATRKVPLAELAAAIRLLARGGGRVTLAWVVIGGINTGQDEVDALAALLGDVPLIINLIDVNDERPDGFQRASPEELEAFRDRLRTLGVPQVRRYAAGRRAHAACGMLTARRAVA